METENNANTVRKARTRKLSDVDLDDPKQLAEIAAALKERVRDLEAAGTRDGSRDPRRNRGRFFHRERDPKHLFPSKKPTSVSEGL